MRRHTLLLCCLLWGCQGSKPPAETALQITDDLGRSISLGTPPKRVISLLPSLSETVCALGACDSLVAVDDYSDFPPELARLPKVGGLTDLRLEVLVAQQPDLVLASRYGTTVQAIARLGIPVAAFAPESLAQQYDVSRRLALLLHRQEQAQALQAQMESDIAALQPSSSPTASQPPSTYLEIDPTPYSASPQSYMGELLILAGGANIVPRGKQPYPRINPELVVSADPRYIILVHDPKQDPLPWLARRPGWEKLSALRERRVCVLNELEAGALTRPGPRAPDGVAALARCIHKAEERSTP